ncbi:MAG TPA: FG-GAP repeat protein [Kofleriaceae bacterium]|nr:FG-GAP repeat protein [Kofleriaceae bacterium]
MGGRTAAAMGLVLVAGCYSPKFTEGLPCSPDMDCPEGQKCIENICLVDGRDAGGGGDGACAPADHRASPLGRLTAADAAEGDQLGGAIAIDGGWMAIGADLDDDRGEDAGAVYMFQREGAGWTERQKLTASDGDMQDGFGTAVALDGATLVVGAPSAGAPAAGAVYVFTLDGSTWTEQTRLAGQVADDLFGRAVAVRGERLGVGAPGAGGGTGEVRMFRGSGATWNPDGGAFIPSDAAESFGSALAMSDDTVAIGSPLDDDAGTASGSVFRLVLDGEDWMSSAKVTASDAGANDQFGTAVALAGSRLVVGAPYRDETGAVYVYDGTSGEVIVTRADQAANDAFGRSVASDASYIAVGVPGDDEGGTSAGSAALFALGDGWVEIDAVRDAAPVDFDTFGASVALDGVQLGVGMPLRDGEPALGEAGGAAAFDLACP